LFGTGGVVPVLIRLFGVHGPVRGGELFVRASFCWRV
jgi:hypothetical protein